MFLMVASYRKRNDSRDISSTDPPHSCTTTNLVWYHCKLSSDIICQDIFPLISKDPLVKVSIIISHIVTRYNYTSSYKKEWITRTKIVEWVYRNWENSYKELPQYFIALNRYASRTIAIMETLTPYTSDITCVSGNRILH